MVFTMKASEENVFSMVEEIIRYTYRYEEKCKLLDILLKNENCGIKILGKNHDKEYKAELFEKDKSLTRITYILRKWHRQQLNGGGIVKYILWEEYEHPYSEKITHIH